MDQGRVTWRVEGQALLSPPYLLFAVAIAIVVALSVAYRRSRFKPLGATPPSEALFVERWRSGRSTAHLLARGGMTSGLMVAVTPHELIVQPHFPFTLAFLPEYLDLEHIVRRKDIRSVKQVLIGWLMKREVVEVQFDSANRRHTLHLELEDPAAFTFAINDMQR
jgi:hypothetical protein